MDSDFEYVTITNSQQKLYEFDTNDTKIKCEISLQDNCSQCKHVDEGLIVSGIKNEHESNDEVESIAIKQEHMQVNSREVEEDIDIECMKYETVNYKCNKCDFTTTFFCSFQVHIDECDKTNEQIKCSGDNTDKSVINDIGGRPFDCKVCGKKFADQRSLKRHNTIHNKGEKSFECNLCRKAFANVQYLRRHMSTHTTGKPFQCKDCSRTFTHSSVLKRHMIIHGTEKSFQCSVCGKGFACALYLKNHIKIHLAEKPFVCKLCDKTFPENISFNRHIKIHKGENPF